MSRLNQFLQGIRVIDVSRHLPGPFATLLLADMGAEVLKIESPGGDELRTMGPPAAGEASAYFQAVNAGKTIYRMDLKQEDQRDAFRELVRGADVVVDSFRPGAMSRLGLGYEQLQAMHPQLIYCSLNGFGTGVPLERAAGHDINYMARSGALDQSGRTTTPSLDLQVADYAGALFAVVAILGALHGRTADGRGCHIDVALSDAVMPLQILQLAALGVTGALPHPGTGLLNGGAACYRMYETADGRHVTLGALEAKFWAAFCAAAGRTDWVVRQQDELPQTALIEEVSEFFRRLTFLECESRFRSVDCCYAPVLDLKEAVVSPRIQARGLVRPTSAGLIEALFPAVVDGERPAARVPFRQRAAPRV